jgi:hypothetical protein
VSPAFLLIVIVGFCITKVPGYLDTLFGNSENAGYARLTWVLILLTIGGITAITAIGSRRWRAQGRDLDGKRSAAD